MQVPWFDAVANAGWAKKACPPRPSGNMRRGVTWLANASPGAIPLRKGDKLANIWQGWLSMKKSAHRWLHLVAPSLPTAMGYPTWSTTPGIGAPTGVGLMRMPPRQMVRGSCRPYRKLGSARPSGAQACHPGWFFSLLSQLLRKLSPGSPPWHLARILACPTSVFAVPGIPAGYCGVCRSVQCAMSYFAAVYLFLLQFPQGKPG